MEPPDQFMMAEANSLVRRFTLMPDMPLTVPLDVITVVQNVDPGSVGWLVNALHQRGLDPVVLPYDAHIAQSWPLRSEELQTGTRRAVLDLAARGRDGHPHCQLIHRKLSIPG
jgi:hypothetical protein